MTKRGLVLFVGATGSGKSTSLAALIDSPQPQQSPATSSPSRTRSSSCTPHKSCIVNQREVGVDTDSYADALKNTLRQAPGRDPDRRDPRLARPWSTPSPSPRPATCAISTLHANNANQALDRIINFFPEERRPAAADWTCR